MKQLVAEVQKKDHDISSLKEKNEELYSNLKVCMYMKYRCTYEILY